MSKQNYAHVILEDVNHKFDIIIEIVKGMQEQLTRKADKEDIARLSGRIDILEVSQRKIISEQINVTSALRALEGRSAQLETRVASLER